MAILDFFPSKEQLKNTAKFVTPRFIGGALVGAILGAPYFAYSTKVALSSLSRVQIATAAGYYGVAVGAAVTMTLAVVSKCYTWYADRKAAAEVARVEAELAAPEAELAAPEAELAAAERVAAELAIVEAARVAAPVLLSDSLRRVSPRRDRAAPNILNVASFSGQSYR